MTYIHEIAGGCNTWPYVGDAPFIPYAPQPVPNWAPNVYPNTTIISTAGGAAKRETNSMDIWMIWIINRSDTVAPIWLKDAWDDDSKANNPAGWEQALQKAYEEVGAENVRVTIGSVDFDAVSAAFEPPHV